MTIHITFLGCSASRGVPELGCGCAVCASALPGQRNRRHRSALLLRGASGTLLIDAGPDLRHQLTAALPFPDALLITHPHDDHILGFSDLLAAARGRGVVLPVVGPGEVLAGLRERFGYMWVGEGWQRTMRLTPWDEPGDLLDLTVAPHRVNHGFNGWAYGFVVTTPSGRRLGYFPDAIDIAPAVQAHLRGLDLLILGANFWQEEAPRAGRSVYDVQEALALAADLGVGELILTHLSHAIDYATVAGRLPPWASLAHDGRTVDL